MKKIKFVHLITRFDKGGSAETVFLIARALVKKENSVEIWCGEGVDIPGEMRARAQKEGIELVVIPSLVRSVRPLKDLSSLFQLIQLLHQKKPDILHTHTSKAGFLGRLAGKFAGVRAIVHTPHGHVFYGYFGPFKTKFYIFLEKLAARWTDRILPLSQQEIDEHLERGIGKKEQYFPVVSGIDPATLDFSNKYREPIRAELNLSKTDLLVGAVGRFVPIKGFDLLIEAIPKVLAHLPKTKFYLGGEGPMKKLLQQRAQELNIEKNIFFAPFHERSEAQLQALDILVVPSRNEAQSRTLVEAMFLKKAVIGANICGIPNVITDGKTGLLVPPENPEALAKTILELLNDSKKRITFGEAAYHDVNQRFTLNAMIEPLEKIYNELYEEKTKK